MHGDWRTLGELYRLKLMFFKAIQILLYFERRAVCCEIAAALKKIAVAKIAPSNFVLPNLTSSRPNMIKYSSCWEPFGSDSTTLLVRNSDSLHLKALEISV